MSVLDEWYNEGLSETEETESEETVSDGGALRPLPPKLAAQEELKRRALQGVGLKPTASPLAAETLEEPPPASPTAVVATETAAAGRKNTQLHDFFNRLQDPSQLTQITLRIPDILEIEFRMMTFWSDRRHSLTLLMTDELHFRPQQGVAYQLVIDRKTYTATWGGGFVEIPGFPWKMLSFITQLQHDDEARRGKSGDIPVSAQW